MDHKSKFIYKTFQSPLTIHFDKFLTIPKCDLDFYTFWRPIGLKIWARLTTSMNSFWKCIFRRAALILDRVPCGLYCAAPPAPRRCTKARPEAAPVTITQWTNSVNFVQKKDNGVKPSFSRPFNLQLYSWKSSPWEIKVGFKS